MQSVQALIDEAVKVCKTKRALASRLGLSEQNLQGVYRGRRHLTIAQTATLAELVDKDLSQVWAVVSIERESDAAERARLSEAFFRRAIAGGVAFALAGGLAIPGESVAAELVRIGHAIHCRELARQIARAVRRHIRAALHLALIWSLPSRLVRGA